MHTTTTSILVNFMFYAWCFCLCILFVCYSWLVFVHLGCWIVVLGRPVGELCDSLYQLAEDCSASCMLLHFKFNGSGYKSTKYSNSWRFHSFVSFSGAIFLTLLFFGVFFSPTPNPLLFLWLVVLKFNNTDVHFPVSYLLHCVCRLGSWGRYQIRFTMQN